jgi:hypothetical protein
VGGAAMQIAFVANADFYHGVGCFWDKDYS